MGVADGLALIMGVGLVTGEDVIATAESVTRIMLIINSLLIVAYLVNANYQSDHGRVVGEGARPRARGLGVLAGHRGPGDHRAVRHLGRELLHRPGGRTGLLIFAIICHTIGAFSLKYGVLKVGIYRPLLPKAHAY